MAIRRQTSLTPGQARARTIPPGYFGSVDLSDIEPSPQNAKKTMSDSLTSPCIPRTRPALANIMNDPTTSPSLPETPKKSAPPIAESPPLPDVSQLLDNDNKQASGKPVSTRRKKFIGMDLVHLARAVNEVCPWNAIHGEKTKAWKAVNAELEKTGFRHELSVDVIRHKAEGLLDYRKNPSSKDTNTRAIAAILDNSQNDLITISALLDRMESDYDAAKSADETKKAELQKKHDNDKIARDVLRQAAVTTQKKRKHTSDTSDTSDTDNEETGSGGSASSSDRPKKPRLSNETSQEKLLKVMKEDIEARHKHETQVEQWMERQEQRQEKVMGFFEGLLRIEEAKLALKKDTK